MSDNSPETVTIGAIASEILGTSANPTVANAIVGWEITWGAQLGTAVGVAVAVVDLPVVASAAVAAALGIAAGWAVQQATDYLTGQITSATAEMQQQADIMNAVNLNGAGMSMPDPVTGMGYW